MYCASKFAVEGLTESLRYETRSLGLHVSLLAPGDFLTEMTEQYAVSAPATEARVYIDATRRAIEVMRADCRAAADLTPFAVRLETILCARRPKLRYSVGLPIQRLGVVLRHFLPDSWMESILRGIYRLG
jgi:NAD(P)-dependent dehydrogenase (short-subunit alcohol dehydrogenase family)